MSLSIKNNALPAYPQVLGEWLFSLLVGVGLEEGRPPPPPSFPSAFRLLPGAVSSGPRLVQLPLRRGLVCGPPWTPPAIPAGGQAQGHPPHFTDQVGVRLPDTQTRWGSPAAQETPPPIPGHLGPDPAQSPFPINSESL